MTTILVYVSNKDTLAISIYMKVTSKVKLLKGMLKTHRQKCMYLYRGSSACICLDTLLIKMGSQGMLQDIAKFLLLDRPLLTS